MFKKCIKYKYFYFFIVVWNTRCYNNISELNSKCIYDISELMLRSM